MIYDMKPGCECGVGFSGPPLQCDLCGALMILTPLSRLARLSSDWRFRCWYPIGNCSDHKPKRA